MPIQQTLQNWTQRVETFPNFRIFGAWLTLVPAPLNIMGKLSNDGGQKNEKKKKVVFSRAARTLAQRRSLQHNNVEKRNERFWPQREHTTVNLSFAHFNSKSLVPVQLQMILRQY